jgi:S-(hydroxymethyl)glutathione dehydrogenase/alcohol dehydrogenase
VNQVLNPQLAFGELYMDGRLKIDELVSRTYTLDQINEGFEALRTGQVARGVVVF